ncbi:MAG: discoidin domain-containing protein [Dysgonomonas sp.]|nr:discoidin domain-containing protein [Dysgonomonas sp.]
MKIFIIGCLFCLSLLFVSCSDDDDTNNGTNVESIKILETVNDTIFLFSGDEYQIKLQTVPANSPVKFYSNKPESFRINQSTGMITTTAGGIGTVIAVAPNGNGWTKAVTTVYITEHIEKISVKSGQETHILAANASVSLAGDFEISRSSATNKKLIYISSKPDVVSIDENTGLLRYVSKGIAQITAKAADDEGVVSDPITVYSGYADTKLSKYDWIATASTTQGNYLPSRVIDGLTSQSNFWHANWDNPQPFPYYVMIDMKAVKSFSKIVLTRRMNYADNRDMEYYISDISTDGLSADDASFRRIHEFTYGDEPASVRVKTFNVFPESFQSRYLKIVMLNSNRGLGDMSISEVDVHAIE